MIINNNRPANALTVSAFNIIHVRDYEADMQTASAHGGVTIVYQIEAVETSLAGLQLMLRAGISSVHPSDVYDRKKGVQLATARMWGKDTQLCLQKERKTGGYVSKGHAIPTKVFPEVTMEVPFNPAMRLTTLLNAPADGDAEVILEYSADGTFYFHGMSELVELMVMNYLDDTLFADIEQRESEDDEIADEDDEEYDDEPTVLVVGAGSAVSDPDDEDDDEEDPPPAPHKKSTRVH